MKKNNIIKNIKYWDLKQKIGLILLILSFLFIIISLILFWTAIFKSYNNNVFFNGFWVLKKYGIINLFYNWDKLDLEAIKNNYIFHPFEQVYFGIIFLIIIFPIFFSFGNILLIRSWIKSRI